MSKRKRFARFIRKVIACVPDGEYNYSGNGWSAPVTQEDDRISGRYPEGRTMNDDQVDGNNEFTVDESLFGDGRTDGIQTVYFADEPQSYRHAVPVIMALCTFMIAVISALSADILHQIHVF